MKQYLFIVIWVFVAALGCESNTTLGGVEIHDDVRGEIQQSLTGANDCPPCVVLLKSYFPDGRASWGTGVLLDDGRIVTARHVLVNEAGFTPQSGSIIFGGRNNNPYFDGARGGTINFRFSDKRLDLAVITNATVPSFAKDKGVRITKNIPSEGDLLTSVGLENLEAVRIHAAPVKLRDTFNSNLIIGVSAQPGDSGGPVFNDQGELVGINSAVGAITRTKTHQIRTPNGTWTFTESHPIKGTIVIDLTAYAAKRFLNNN